MLFSTRSASSLTLPCRSNTATSSISSAEFDVRRRCSATRRPAARPVFMAIVRNHGRKLETSRRSPIFRRTVSATSCRRSSRSSVDGRYATKIAAAHRRCPRQSSSRASRSPAIAFATRASGESDSRAGSPCAPCDSRMAMVEHLDDVPPVFRHCFSRKWRKTKKRHHSKIEGCRTSVLARWLRGSDGSRSGRLRFDTVRAVCAWLGRIRERSRCPACRTGTCRRASRRRRRGSRS